MISNALYTKLLEIEYDRRKRCNGVVIRCPMYTSQIGSAKDFDDTL